MNFYLVTKYGLIDHMPPICKTYPMNGCIVLKAANVKVSRVKGGKNLLALQRHLGEAGGVL